MSLTRIELDVMQEQERFLVHGIPKLLVLMERQAEALERIAKTVEDIQTFLHGTTIKQVEDKRKDLKNKNRKKGKSSEKAKIAEAKAFLEEHTE
tara:strand:- start:1287 stop:1568 length:282 start_codon:yes stop_codon:yes gene_type:complete